MKFGYEMEKKWQTLLNVLNRLIGLFRVFVTSWSEWIENCTGWMSKCISGNGGNVETRWIGTSLSIWFLTFVFSMSVGCVVEWLLWLFLIDLECLKWKWTTSHSPPISPSSCSSWHAYSFEMALWKVKNWDMFIHSVVWVPASSTWLSLGKLWKQEGFVIIFLWFAICYVFVNAGLTGRTGRRTGRPSLCSALYCSAILEEEVEEEGKEGKWKGREKKTDSQPNPEPSLGESEILRSFWMEGVVTSYAISATLLSPVSLALLCVE